MVIASDAASPGIHRRYPELVEESRPDKTTPRFLGFARDDGGGVNLQYRVAMQTEAATVSTCDRYDVTGSAG